MSNQQGLICDPTTSTCKNEVDCMSFARRGAPNCKTFNSLCLCVECHTNWYGNDCATECPISSGVAVFLDIFWLLLAVWIFLIFIYYINRTTKNDDKEDQWDQQDELDRLEEKEQRKLDGQDGTPPEETLKAPRSRRGRLRIRSLRTVLISRMQITAAIYGSIVWDAKTPKAFKEFAGFLTNIFTLNIGHLLISPDCMYDPYMMYDIKYLASQSNKSYTAYLNDLSNNQFMGKWYLELCTSLCIVLFIFIWYQCHQRKTKRGTGTVTATNPKVLGTIHRIGVQVVFLWLFENLTSTSFKMLDCTGGVTGKLVMFPSKPCPFEKDVFPAVLSIFVIFLYVVIPYTWFLRNQWCKRGDGGTYFKWALVDYVTSFRAWELWHITTKIIIVLGSSVMYPQVRFFTHGVISMLSLLAHLILRPYKDKESNNAVVLFCFCDVLGVNSAWVSTGGSGATTGGTTTSESSFEGIQIAFVLSLVVVLLYILYNTIKAFREREFEHPVGNSQHEYTTMEQKLLSPIFIWMKLLSKVFPKNIAKKITYDEDDGNDMVGEGGSVSSNDPNYISRSNSQDRLMVLMGTVENNDGNGRDEEDEDDDMVGKRDSNGTNGSINRFGTMREKPMAMQQSNQNQNEFVPAPPRQSNALDDEVDELDSWLEGKQIELGEMDVEKGDRVAVNGDDVISGMVGDDSDGEEEELNLFDGLIE